MRTAQGYLVKFPEELIKAIPRLALALEAPEGLAPGAPAQTSGHTRSPRAYLSDKVLRKALEDHAVRRVMDYLTEQQYKCEDVGSTRSYDIVALRGSEELHVEVKGSAGDKLTVELTDGEVQHARSTQPTLLAVVDQIGFERRGETVVTSGGRLRLWWEWEPNDEALVPVQYRYLLPGDEIIVPYHRTP
jgi:hypothetical protein